MSKKFATAQTFIINPSSLHSKGLVFLHLIALVATVFNALGVIYKLIICTSILISLFINKKNTPKKYILRFSLLAGWAIDFAENHYHPITIIPSTVITRFLIILHFKMQNQKKQTILIFNDALNGDEYRKLVVELKISGLAKDDNEPN